jgi:hypothetical protein
VHRINRQAHFLQDLFTIERTTASLCTMALTGITAAGHRAKWGQQERSDAIGGRA